jgi:ribosomal protein S12 methylthiotransferase accessory factor
MMAGGNLQDGRMLEPRLVDRNVKPAAAALAEAARGHPDSRLLALGERTDELFQLGSPYAPGLVYVGGMARLDRLLATSGATVPISGGGTGLDLAAALGACLGETVEYACQFPAEPDLGSKAIEHRGLVERLNASGHAAALDLWRAPDDAHRDVPLISALALHTGEKIDLPAALFLRGGADGLPVMPVMPLGSGIAAGRTRAEAEEHALLELIERDAAARWWCLGRPGRAPTPGELGDAHRAVERALGRPETSRRWWLIDISTHVPVVAALSCAEDGRQLAVGLAARRSLGHAASAALLEMCQMELSLALIHGRVRHRGEAALSPFERRHFERSRHLCVNDHGILLPLRAADAGLSKGDPTVPPLTALKQQGIAVYAADLTHRNLGIPVVAVRSPHLLPVPTEAVAKEPPTAGAPQALSELSARGFMLL